MDYLTALNELVYQDQKTVTYRTLSRHLGVHVNFAKQMLFEFLETAPPLGVTTRAEATYCLTGYKRPDKGKERALDDAQVDPQAGEVAPEFVILLAAGDMLESAKASFATLTGIHVYSVGIGRPKDLDVVTAANVDLAENTATARYGIIKNPKIRFVERDKRNDSSAAPPPECKASLAKATTSERNSPLEKPAVHVVAARSKSSESAASSISASLSKRSTSAGFARRKTAREPASSGNGSRISETFFGKPRGKTKQEPAKPKSHEKDARPSTESDNETSGTDDEERDRRLALESMRAAMEMDDSPLGEADPQEDNEAAQQAERRAEVIAGLEQAESEEGAQPSPFLVLPAMLTNTSPHPAASVESGRAAEQEAHRMDGGVGPKRRVRRKVVKSVTSKTERGYIETRDVVVWESFSEDEGAEVAPQKRAAVDDEDDRPKAAISPARKSPTKAKMAVTAAGGRKDAEAGKGKKGKGSGGQQASLLRFWKK